MNELHEVIVKSVPALAALIFLVIYLSQMFLKHLEKADSRSKESQEKLVEAINNNTTVLQEYVHTSKRVEILLGKFYRNEEGMIIANKNGI